VDICVFKKIWYKERKRKEVLIMVHSLNGFFKDPVILSDPLKRKEYIDRYSFNLKERIGLAFTVLQNDQLVQSFCFFKEKIGNSSMTFKVTYNCITNNNTAVQFQFIIDLRGSNSKNNTMFCNSRFCKVQVPLNSSKDNICSIIRFRLGIWNNGSSNEKNFTAYLNLLADQNNRITRTYKTNSYTDKNNGIDFIVCYLAKPEYEEREVRFNLKSSIFYLDAHKSKFPTVSTFVFSKDALENEKMLERKFLRFLLIATHQTAHM
jgi:hypothetical protein